MAEARARDTLQPALLERLTDHDPTRTTEGREDRVLTRSQLRAAVLRDLTWLFNTTNLLAGDAAKKYPLVAESTVNYGLEPLSGRSVSSLDLPGLERVLTEAIKRFEPRILPRTLRVRAVLPDDPQHRNALAFEIEGELWGQPLPSHLFLKSEIDLEDGSMTVVEGSEPGAG